jgi:hypothetical protein
VLDALQLLLDLVGMVPGAGAIPDLLNGCISLARGDFFGAALSVFSAIPAAGDVVGAGKIIKNAEKYVEALKLVESKVLPKLPANVAKPLKEFIDKAKDKLDELMGKGKTAEKAPDAPNGKPKTGEEDEAAKKGDTQVKKTPKDCSALASGVPGSEYKGGSHGKMSPGGKSRDQEAHHMPSNKASPHAYSDGPTIQMDTADHKQTASHDNKPQAAAYRAAQELLASQGKSGFTKAFFMDVIDIETKFPGKYTAAIAQAAAYAKCMGYM